MMKENNDEGTDRKTSQRQQRQEEAMRQKDEKQARWMLAATQ